MKVFSVLLDQFPYSTSDVVCKVSIILCPSTICTSGSTVLHIFCSLYVPFVEINIKTFTRLSKKCLLQIEVDFFVLLIFQFTAFAFYVDVCFTIFFVMTISAIFLNLTGLQVRILYLVFQRLHERFHIHLKMLDFIKLYYKYPYLF